MSHESKERERKLQKDKISEDREGIAPRLNELIRWARWGVLILGGIAIMVSLFFIRDAVTVIISLFK